MVTGDLPFFELSISRRGRTWRWRVADQSGNIELGGGERSRAAARYFATRAFFHLLLTATCQTRSKSLPTPFRR
jgi:hypothetical protein